MHDVLKMVTRGESRRLLDNEAAARRTGEWGPWEFIRFPRGTVGPGWAADFERAHKNRVFAVLDRTLACGVRHLAVTSLSDIRPSWPEMQRIKDELAGRDRTAVEVYPPNDQIVDEANMYHIWVLPYPLSFGLHD